MRINAALVCQIALAIISIAYSDSDLQSGSLSTTEPAATSAGTETERNVTVGGSSSLHMSEDKRNKDCFCSYEYEDPSVDAQIEHKALKVGDTIKRGKRVTFKCKSSDMALTWQNGLRLRGDISVICNVCKKWQMDDVPMCKKVDRSEPLISFNRPSYILPGGIAIVEKGVYYEFFCYNSWRDPEWDYGQRKHVSIKKDRSILGYYYIAHMVIWEDENDVSGKYECYVKDDSGQRLGFTFLHLHVNDPCYTKDLDYPGLAKPTEEHFDSFESFEVNCESGYRKTAKIQTISCVLGRWEISQNPCTPDYISCPEFTHTPGLNVTYSKDLSVGSVASFECSLPNKVLNGSSSSICQENGRWSYPLPFCEGSCKVPFIENGELGTDGIPHSRTETYDAFTKVPAMEYVESQQTLALRCKNGYRPVENSDVIFCSDRVKVTCNDGSWSRDLQCKRIIPCDPPKKIENGHVTVLSFEYVSELEYKCDKGFSLNTDEAIYCTEEGRWSKTEVACIGVQSCFLDLDPSSHLIVEPRKNSYRTGDQILLSCPPREEMSKQVYRVMCLNGAWSDPFPNCIKLD